MNLHPRFSLRSVVASAMPCNFACISAAILLLLGASSIAQQPGSASPGAKPQPAANAKPAPALHEHPTIVAMLAENNRLRGTAGKGAQEISPELTKAAQDHAWFMARTGTFSHDSNGGMIGRAAKFGYTGALRENIAMGQTSVAEAFKSWKESPGHWTNLTSDLRRVGFGYARATDGTTYWVTLYGN